MSDWARERKRDASSQCWLATRTVTAVLHIVDACICVSPVSRGLPERFVSSTPCVCWKTESFGVPATPYNVTARTSPCAERMERHYSNDCERKLEECRTETDIPVKQQGPCGECGELCNVFLCVLVILCQRNRCCLISIVSLLVFGCVLWETLVEGAHSLSFPCRSHSAISSDDTWNADFMFHSCPHPSSASRPHQSFHVQMSRHFPLCPLCPFWLSLNCFFCSSVSLCLSLSVWRLLRAAAGHTTRCERGRVQPLTFLLEFRPVGLLQGGPQRAGLMSFFYLYLFVSVSCVCLRDGGWLEWPSCSSSPHGTIWKGSEVMELFFFSSAVFVWMNHFPIILTLLLPRYRFAWMHACSPLDRSYVSFSVMLKHRNRIYTITQT